MRLIINVIYANYQNINNKFIFIFLDSSLHLLVLSVLLMKIFKVLLLLLRKFKIKAANTVLLNIYDVEMIENVNYKFWKR